jgi:hypothetical protein
MGFMGVSLTFNAVFIVIKRDGLAFIIKNNTFIIKKRNILSKTNHLLSKMGFYYQKHKITRNDHDGHATV